MDQSSETSEVIGYWYGAQVLCPECFERQGWVPHEGVISPDDLVGLLTRCAICGIPLWALQEAEEGGEDSWEFQPGSPVKEVRSKRAWTKEQFALVLGTNKRAITMLEEGKRNLSDKFYLPLKEIGEDPNKLALEQQDYMRWRRQFRSYIRQGLKPKDIQR